MTGVGGELALHFLARMVGLESKLLLPSLSPQPVDHRIRADSRQLAIQSKASCLTNGVSVNTIYGGFRFQLDHCDSGLDYYSFALATDENLYSDSAYLAVHLFALVPISFVKQHAKVDKRFGRHITFEGLQAADEAFDYRVLHAKRLSQATIAMDASAYTSLISQDFDNRLLAALDVIGSANDASRVLDMLHEHPGLLKALRAADRDHQVIQPASEMTRVAQQRAPEVA
jgi:hypothetical protein